MLPNRHGERAIKKILITGGAGFLGSHLCKKLLECGNKIICLDNLQTGFKENIKSLLKNPDFEFVLHDITESYNFDVDEIYNLACPASPMHYQADPVKTIKTSFLGALNALELAKKTGARLLQASTSEVYGDPTVHPQPEVYFGNVNCTGVRACYDEGKRAAETLVFDYNRLHKVQTRIARIFNTYGENMHPDDGRVVSNFITQALQKKDITVYGKGLQTRSFCYVSDLVDGIIRLMNSNETRPVNLGNPGEFTILELAQKVIKLTASSSKITFHTLPQDDPAQRQPDITRAKQVLNWQPLVSLEEGLVKTIYYFKNINTINSLHAKI